MASPFQTAGAQPTKASKYAPLFVNRFFTGLWTQRNVLRDAGTSFLQEKYYGGGHFDSLIDGLNVELTTRLTLARRPGLSIYNSQLFADIQRFYEFRQFSATTGQVLGASLNNPGLAYTVGDVLTIQAGDTNATLVVTQTAGSPGPIVAWGYYIKDGGSSYVVATAVAVAGGSGNSATFDIFSVGSSGGETIRVLADTATTVYDATGPNTKLAIFTKAAGSAQTAFQSVGNTVFTGDGVDRLKWDGAALTQWGIETPGSAPVVANTIFSGAQPNWAASTFYSPSLLIVDSSTPANIQIVTTPGTTGASPPNPSGGGGTEWSTTPGGTTTDGGVTWTCVGPADWQSNHAYTANPGGPGSPVSNSYVAVSYSVTVYVNEFDPNTGLFGPVAHTSSYIDFFMCVTAGTSTTGVVGDVLWQPGLYSQVTDNSVVWANVGPQATRVTGATTGTVIGDLQPVSDNTTIVDSNENVEYVQAPGESGSVTPTWQAMGAFTSDGILSWYNSRPLSIAPAGSAAVKYVYSFRNSHTEHVGTASDVSNAVIVQLNSFITVQGDRSPDPQIDTVEIYRTAQGGSQFLWLADTPNPPSGKWTYKDTLPDVQLNEFVLAPINHANDRPPVGLTNLTYHLNHIFGSVANIVYYSGGPDTTTGVGNESFPPANNFFFPARVVRMWPQVNGLLVFTESGVYAILGQGTLASPLYPSPFVDKLGLAGYNAFDVNGGIAYLVTTDMQALSFDPGAGVSEVGFPIGDQIQNKFDAAHTYMAWHNGGSSDKALYLSLAAGQINPLVGPEVTVGLPGSLVRNIFLLQNVPDPPQSLQLFSNGLLLTPVDDYILTANVVVLTNPLAIADENPVAWYRISNPSGYVDAIQPTGTIDGGNKVFSIAFMPNAPNPAASLELYLNGVLQTPGGVDYTLAGSTITFVNAPAAVDKRPICWYRWAAPASFVDAEIPSGATDGANNSFQLAQTPAPPTSVMLYENGVLQTIHIDFEINGQIITMTNPPEVGDALIAWYRIGNTPTAGAGWYRMNQTASPETGLNWSPFASINQAPASGGFGCSAVQSVETSPGIQSLLVGPAGAGPILRRNRSIFTDNGAPYEAFATVGSLVLAHPGQVAAVGFITTDCPSTGTSPNMYVWMEEDSTAPGAPAGSLLSTSVDDPPIRAASATFLGKRYYMSQTLLPAWCRHMQVKFDWGASTKPDELLTYTLFGTIYAEQ